MAESNVLIIEDQDYIADLLRDVFALYDEDALCALNGKDALEILRTHPVKLLVLDYSLPDMNGIDLYNKISQEFPHLNNRVIFMSGYDRNTVLEGFLNDNPVTFMAKPFMINDFQEVIERMLDK